MDNKGKAGCGCLFILLIIIMVFLGLFIHPFTLKIISKQFRYEDRIFKSDVIFVPYFAEDKHGETYIEAFREYWAGNGRAIWIEDEKVLGVSLFDIVNQLARTRGIKENVIFKVEADGDEKTRIDKIKNIIIKSGVKKIIVIVPEYASRRFHLLLNGKDEKLTFILKPVHLSCFKMDRWWKDSISRQLLFREAWEIGSIYFQKFKIGETKNNKEKK
ncbi:MAG TPA: hypothetical protein PLM71_06835 [Syntrophorhabdaceae bacterium]|nr:hypothetical protein [Syntrophorhabdaceae bacterium]HPU30019.1 hypothetical protein [Syntrophorhabdaceae bacterium]